MPAPVRIPGVTYAAAPRAESRASVLTWPPRIIVVHDTGNPSSDRFDEAHYAATRTDAVEHWTSCQVYVDDGGVLGSLRLDRQAWAAYGYANRNGLHIEMCLPGNRAETHRRTAAVVRQLCEMAGIPMVKLTPAQVAAGNRGVCGHHDVTVGLGVGSHIDPDREGHPFPWSSFMAMVTNAPSSQNVEPPDVNADQNQRLVNDNQTLFAISQLDPIADGVTVAGVSDEHDRMELPIVRLLTTVRDDVKAIKDVSIPPLHGSEGSVTAEALQAAVVAALESPAGKAAIVAAVNQGEDS